MRSGGPQKRDLGSPTKGQNDHSKMHFVKASHSTGSKLVQKNAFDLFVCVHIAHLILNCQRLPRNIRCISKSSWSVLASAWQWQETSYSLFQEGLLSLHPSNSFSTTSEQKTHTVFRWQPAAASLRWAGGVSAHSYSAVS